MAYFTKYIEYRKIISFTVMVYSIAKINSVNIIISCVLKGREIFFPCLYVSYISRFLDKSFKSFTGLSVRHKNKVSWSIECFNFYFRLLKYSKESVLRSRRFQVYLSIICWKTKFYILN